ncbi:unnamed protein product [Alopecurus aequalis]
MAASGHIVVDVGTEEDASAGQPPVAPVPYLLSFADLSYRVNTATGGRLTSFVRRRARETKLLLDGVSGEARESELFAVMGASGSGKSTLVDALAGRIERESLHGRVTLNGETLHGRRLRAISAYVMQDDLLYPMLTVRETLMFAAEFRLPRALSPARKRERVDALIAQLGLSAAADTVIGDEGHRGVSGGERRRVSIGTDIIHDPILLFLDEPTSGLDSASAFMVVQVLRNIARSGSVVVMTIHQPSARILGILGRLLLLSRGRTVYAGTPAGLVPFFSEFGTPIPHNENPAEFALDTIKELEGRAPDGSRPLAEFNARWQAEHRVVENACTMPLELAIAESVHHGKLVAGSETSGTASSSVPTFANPLMVEVWVLMKRSFTNTRRMPELFVMRLGTIMLTGFILATIFLRLDDTPKGVQERLGFFAMGMSTMFYVCADALPVFVQERHIYLRETAHNAYRRISYVLSNAFVSFPPLRVRDVPIGGGAARDAGLHGGGGHPRLLPPILRLLHQPGPDPQLLDMVPLHLARQVPLPGRAAERVRRRDAVLRTRDRVVRRDAHRWHDGGRENEGARRYRHRPRHQHDSQHVRRHRCRRARAAGRHGHVEVDVPPGDGGIRLLLPSSLLRRPARREQEQAEVDM